MNPDAVGFTPPFACPRCHAPLHFTTPNELLCPTDGLRFERHAGIWHFLLPERAPFFEQFIREYESIRRAEGRISTDPAYYRALPHFDLSGRMAADWRIRAASFDAFLGRVLLSQEHVKTPLTVLDLGAGNGWLSNQLAARGHHLIAIDLLTNDFDGLGCHAYFEHSFTPIQAEFERLPLPTASADLVIFNASLHYSVNFAVTLAEALRVLAPQGRLVVLDSPVYHDAGSGAQMVKERESAFLKQYGFASNALPSKNYLTYAEIKQLGEALDLRWQKLTPFYGLNWLLRPLKAKLLRRREPAKFHVLVAQRR